MLCLAAGLSNSCVNAVLEETSRLVGRVLLVDTCPDSLRITGRLLSTLGLKVTTATNGREAVGIALLAKQAAYGFDLILMDMKLLILEGIRPSVLLRANGFEAPILAIACHNTPGMERECIAAGCNGYIPQPISLHQVYQGLCLYLKSSPPLEQRSLVTLAAMRFKRRSF